MIEFTLNRNKNGKIKRGSEKAAGWYFHNWLDDNYHYFHGDYKKRSKRGKGFLMFYHLI